jgi:hypothetical protein
MPQVTFKGMRIEEVCKLSTDLKNKIEETVCCERKDIKFDFVETININEGTVIESFPKIEMLWLPKTQEVQDRTAELITVIVKEFGYDHVQVSFKLVPGERFYENGKHY